MTSSTRFDLAIRKIDQENSNDPNFEDENGSQIPKELLYAKRMTDRLASFLPDASEALQIAVRSQHICRWTLPRSSFPMNRKGYNEWRGKLRDFHAEKTSEILNEVGYEDDVTARVTSMIRKENMGGDAETQALEDVVCLVFLEHYFDDFLEKHDEEKIIRIVRKTWKKMSESGREAALKLSLSEKSLRLVQKSVAADS